jgi:hypothetical protein
VIFLAMLPLASFSVEGVWIDWSMGLIRRSQHVPCAAWLNVAPTKMPISNQGLLMDWAKHGVKVAHSDDLKREDNAHGRPARIKLSSFRLS